MTDVGKLACIRIQLPPSMKFRKDRVEAFLKILPSELRFALEYRNETWLTDEAHELLSDYNVAAVVVDEPLLPPEVRVTSDIAYVRWHGRGEKMWYNYRYKGEELAAWIPKVKELPHEVDLYGYFNNNYHGYAPENCINVVECLESIRLSRKRSKQRIMEYRKGRTLTKHVPKTLTDFFGQEKEASLKRHITI